MTGRGQAGVGLFEEPGGEWLEALIESIEDVGFGVGFFDVEQLPTATTPATCR